MGVCVCTNPQPYILTRPLLEASPDQEEKQHQRMLVFANKTMSAPKLKLEENLLYYRRKVSGNEEVIT